MTYAWRARVLHLYLTHLAALGRPILIGPWRSELGFEVLYWLPFVRWAQQYAGFAADRCIAVSRGGMGMLYPAARQIDLYRLRGADGVRLENHIDWESRRMLKQMAVTPWDRQVLADAAAELGLGRYAVLHPSWMYWLFEPIWADQAPLRHLYQHLHFEPLPTPKIADAELPEQFIAVRFYERATFPLTEETKTFAREVVQRLAQHLPVLLLNQSVCVDDHSDFHLGPMQNVLTMDQVKLEENLAAQAAVLARAQAFVGTYGGVAQWALRYGKPALSFYTRFSGTAPQHLALSQRLAMQLGVPFEVLSANGVRLVDTALRAAATTAVGVGDA